MLFHYISFSIHSFYVCRSCQRCFHRNACYCSYCYCPINNIPLEYHTSGPRPPDSLFLLTPITGEIGPIEVKLFARFYARLIRYRFQLRYTRLHTTRISLPLSDCRRLFPAVNIDFAFIFKAKPQANNRIGCLSPRSGRYCEFRVSLLTLPSSSRVLDTVNAKSICYV